MTLTVEVKLLPLGGSVTKSYKTESDAGLDATDTLQLIDFQSLHAVATATDEDGGVSDVEVHASLDQFCAPPGAGAVSNAKSNHDADAAKGPGDEALASRITYLDVDKIADAPSCPSGSIPDGALHVHVWAVGRNFHGGVTTSPRVVFMFLR